MNKKQSQTSWGGVATWYDGLIEDSSDSFQKNVIMPNLIRIVAPAKGMTILDVACGQGYFSRAFADNGAKVIASDISPELIELAKKNAVKEVEYYVASADKLPFATDSSADVAVIVLALQNIENLPGTISECSRALKSGGRLIVVLNHPAFRIPQNSSWQWDEKEAKQYRRVDSYMSDAQIKIDMTPGEPVVSKKKFTQSFHRPLQSYFKALNKSGLAVTRLEEWISHKKSQKGPRAQEEDRTRKEMPMFICLEAKKI
jgi:ubiquinone/menaquinone biosynthesis C-methylase UbiE